MKNSTINTVIGGFGTDLPDAVRDTLEKSVRDLSHNLEVARVNRRTSKTLKDSIKDGTRFSASDVKDAEAFTTISEMINGSTKDFAGFGTMLDSLYAKNKKYFTIIKDYEIMPILIPQINRVLGFLVNECLSPDVQSDQTFIIKYTGQDSSSTVQDDIDRIKKEMKLDNLLREVYTNRYKLGREYYIVEDYNKTFDHMVEVLQQKHLNESTAGMTDADFLDSFYSGFTSRIDEMSTEIPVIAVVDDKRHSAMRDNETCIKETSIKLDFPDLNIVIERTPLVKMVEDAHAELISESYSRYSTKALLSGGVGSLNEATQFDTSRLEQLVTVMRKKKLQRCTIRRFDPAKLFKLKVGGKVIGYFYVTDINENTANVVNFAQSLKDQLLKSRATNLGVATQTAEEVISKELAKKIINTFDPNIGITRVEDIDLMHDFIRNNEIYKGNKRITFYYADEIFDMSRADDSILTNAVFFTKLYATLLLNNIITKVLRGRGRQIHTVRIGTSPNVQRYIDNAMASLAMPEHNLGTLHGSFETIMNPFNGASDIVIPTDEDNEQYIRTDYIPGQDVDMNDEFLKTLLNSIITSFGLDAAVLDATNGNLQFARTLTMESLQICTSIRNEQQDLHDPWADMCIEILHIMGNEQTRAAIENDQIEVSFFEPKSLIIQNTIEDINNAKSLVEAIADIIPELNDEDTELLRNKFVYTAVKGKTNFDFKEFEDILKEVGITSIDDRLKSEIRTLIREYMENTKDVDYGENPDGEYAEGSEPGAEGDVGTGGPTGGEGEDTDTALTPEEEELENMPEEEDDEL